MEGISGLTDPEEMHPQGRGYERGVELMTGDANAAVAGAHEAGADSVVVTDAHSSGKNLRADLVDTRCSLVRGPYRPLRMGEGLDGTCRAAMFVGYHARAGTSHGVLNHTWMGKEIHNVYLNGEVTGEIRLIAALAGTMGVPVALVTGDEAACAEARELLGDVATVPVKRGIDRFAAELVPPPRAQEEIRRAAIQALESLERFEPYIVPPPYTLGVEWNSTAIAHACTAVPGVRLVGPRHTEITSNDYGDIVGALGLFSTVGGSIGCSSGIYG